MAKKRETPANPEGAPLRAYIAALRHHPPDPAYAAFAKRLGPERTANLGAALAELIRGRLALSASRLAFHEGRRQMHANHEQIRVRMGLSPSSDAPEWIDERLLQWSFADAAQEQHLARVADRIARLPLDAEAGHGRRMSGRKRGAVNKLTKRLHGYFQATLSRHRERRADGSRRPPARTRTLQHEDRSAGPLGGCRQGRVVEQHPETP
jgi:hypothetical protein